MIDIPTWTMAHSLQYPINDEDDNDTPTPCHGPSSLPPELMASVFMYLPLKDLLPLRRVSARWTEMVDTEAKVRLLRLAENPECPLVLQAGPPAIYDVCEYLPLTFHSFREEGRCHRAHQHESCPCSSASARAPLLASMSISHSSCNPYHSSNMASDVNTAFQNIILSITRRENKYDRRNGVGGGGVGGQFSSEGATSGTMFSNWTNWELAKATERLWREWWEQTCPTPVLDINVDVDPDEAEHINDSGFAETIEEAHLGTKLELSDIKSPSVSLKEIAAAVGYREQTLDIRKTISGATMEICRKTLRSPHGEDEERHEYQWKMIHLDVYRLLLAFEERTRRTGMSAILQTAFVV